ncbi:TPA: hypothetical protein ACWZZU_001077 [Streptococcus agalactiae]
MAKKTTWQDAKKKYDKGLEDAEKLKKQAKDLADKIKSQEQANREAYANYMTLLSEVSPKTQKEIEDFLLGKTPYSPGGD